jgi:hypothetical protein
MTYLLGVHHFHLDKVQAWLLNAKEYPHSYVLHPLLDNPEKVWPYTHLTEIGVLILGGRSVHFTSKSFTLPYHFNLIDNHPIELYHPA